MRLSTRDATAGYHPQIARYRGTPNLPQCQPEGTKNQHKNQWPHPPRLSDHRSFSPLSSRPYSPRAILENSRMASQKLRNGTKNQSCTLKGNHYNDGIRLRVKLDGFKCVYFQHHHHQVLIRKARSMRNKELTLPYTSIWQRVNKPYHTREKRQVSSRHRTTDTGTQGRSGMAGKREGTIGLSPALSLDSISQLLSFQTPDWPPICYLW